MNRRTRCTLTAMALLGLAITSFPPFGFAQSDPFTGLWQLNLAKSKFTPGPAPKSQTVDIQAEGQNRKMTAVGITAAGNAAVDAWPEFVVDGKPHPVTGNPDVDTDTYTPVDARTINMSRVKDGKTVGTATLAVSPDGKTMTFTNIITQATGRQINDIRVFDKQ